MRAGAAAIASRPADRSMNRRVLYLNGSLGVRMLKRAVHFKLRPEPMNRLPPDCMETTDNCHLI